MGTRNIRSALKRIRAVQNVSRRHHDEMGKSQEQRWDEMYVAGHWIRGAKVRDAR